LQVLVLPLTEDGPSLTPRAHNSFRAKTGRDIRKKRKRRRCRRKKKGKGIKKKEKKGFPGNSLICFLLFFCFEAVPWYLVQHAILEGLNRNGSLNGYLFVYEGVGCHCLSEALLECLSAYAGLQQTALDDKEIETRETRKKGTMR